MDLSASMSSSVGDLFAGLPSLSIVSMVGLVGSFESPRRGNQTRSSVMTSGRRQLALRSWPSRKRLQLNLAELGNFIYFFLKDSYICMYKNLPAFRHQMKKYLLNNWHTKWRHWRLQCIRGVLIPPTYVTLKIKILFWVIIFLRHSNIAFYQ